jgi:hypothetical protein
MTIQPGPSQPHTIPEARPGPGPAAPGHIVNRSLLTVGLVAAVVGILVEIAMGFLHPSHAQPNNSAAAFEEYSHSQDWTYVHIGQFAGTLLVVIALVAIARTMAGQPGMAGASAVVGTVTAVLIGAVFAVQMAVDGVALKGTVDTWAHAQTAADRSAAFLVADGVRWVEKALSSFFHLLNGTTLLALGLSVLFGQMARRWLGWVGVVAGIGFLVGGAITSRTGFSPDASRVLTPALLLSAVFLIGTAVSLRRRHGDDHPVPVI